MHCNLANAFSEQGIRDETLVYWRRALELQPDHAETHAQLAHALLEMGRPEQALVHAQHAVSLCPQLAQAHYAAGAVLAGLGKWQASADSYREAARCRPDWADAHCQLARALQVQGMLDEALDCVWQALFLEPNLAQGYHLLGINCATRGLNRIAIRHFRQALRLQPDFPQAACDLARVLRRQGRLDEALACLNKALERRPDAPQLHCDLGNTLVACQRLVEGLPHFREALRLNPSCAHTHSCLLYALNFDPATDGDMLYREHLEWARVHGRQPYLGPAPDHDRSAHRRLRIGYVSSKFCRHVDMYFVEPILSHHDAQRFEVICYADQIYADDLTTQVRAWAHQWRPIGGLCDAEVAELVRGDAVDILVDLGAHLGGRLGVFARRPAPVQVTYLVYPNTTGLQSMHYRLTDAVADPSGEPVRHTEGLVRLPLGFSCYAPGRDAPKVKPLPALAAGCLTFGSPHKPAKLNEQVLDLWCAVLRAIPTARLLLFRDSLRGTVREDFRQRFDRRGVEAGRVLFEHRGGRKNYWKFADTDIVLDTLPYGAGGTACESLWMGVPVLTLAGERYAGRTAASFLTQLGMTEWIARTAEEFIAKAVHWAGRLDQLAALRLTLRERMQTSPLCDGAAFTRELEEAYRAMWLRWVERKKPRTEKRAAEPL